MHAYFITWHNLQLAAYEYRIFDRNQNPNIWLPNYSKMHSPNRGVTIHRCIDDRDTHHKTAYRNTDWVHIKLYKNLNIQTNTELIYPNKFFWDLYETNFWSWALPYFMYNDYRSDS